jgi:rubrerythrin
MLSRELDNLLANLAKIERGIARVYEYLSKQEAFTPPVRRFWKTIMEEERVHEKIFNDIRERARVDDSFHIEIDTDLETLKGIVQKLNMLLEDMKKSNVSESRAYSFGATIEIEIDEANFLKKIKANDPEITKRLNRIDSETQKHRAMMVNYSRGIR